MGPLDELLAPFFDLDGDGELDDVEKIDMFDTVFGLDEEDDTPAASVFDDDFESDDTNDDFGDDPDDGLDDDFGDDGECDDEFDF